MANIAPYRLATGTASLLATGTRTRLAALVTQTPSTAVPLAQIFNNQDYELALAPSLKIFHHDN